MVDILDGVRKEVAVKYLKLDKKKIKIKTVFNN